jgi:hypothetical protein
MCTAEEKIAALSHRASIALIGNSWASHSAAQLRAVFNFADFDSIDFHVINRSLPRELLSEPNVTLHEAAGVEDMLRVVMQSHYVAAPIGGTKVG